MMNIFISGITGKVGQLLTHKILKDDSFNLVGGSCSLNNDLIGKDIGVLLNLKELNLFIESVITAEKDIDLIIDFSSPQSSLQTLKEARSRKIPLLIGTTGFNEDQLNTINIASKDIPILLSSNTSTGIAALKTILNNSKNLFSEENSFILEETHHIEKKDSPSGTALDLKNLIKEIFPSSKMTVESFREGTNPGEHTVRINLEGEHIELTHRAEDRAIFVIGALKGARWLDSKSPGLYQMSDIYSS